MDLSFLFGKKKLKVPMDLSLIGSDTHSHLIPGVDDGVRTMEESLSAIRKMKELGYRKLITTPHVQKEYFPNTPQTIGEGLAGVKQAVAEAGIAIELEAAAEYLVDEGFAAIMEAGKLLTFGDDFVLVELSYYNPYPGLNDLIFRLQIDGYKVVLAHPERYSYWFSSFDRYSDLKDKGVFFQCNLLSLAGAYPEPVKKMAERLIGEGMIEFAGSDLHGERHFEALDEARFSRALEQLINSGRLLNKEV